MCECVTGAPMPDGVLGQGWGELWVLSFVRLAPNENGGQEMDGAPAGVTLRSHVSCDNVG